LLSAYTAAEARGGPAGAQAFLGDAARRASLRSALMVRACCVFFRGARGGAPACTRICFGRVVVDVLNPPSPNKYAKRRPTPRRGPTRAGSRKHPPSSSHSSSSSSPTSSSSKTRPQQRQPARRSCSASSRATRASRCARCATGPAR
jgi:hypothetical protein